MKVFTALLISIAFVLLSGCAQLRVVAIPDVADAGMLIATRNKYRLVKPDDLRVVFENVQPNVFSPDGIPFVLQEGEYHVVDKPGAMFLPYAMLCGFTIMTLPLATWGESSLDYTIKIGGRNGEKSMFDLRKKEDSIISLSPLSLLFPYGEPSPISGRRLYFHRHTNCFSSQTEQDHNRAEIKRITDSAIAYGVAVKLKELEDAGKIDAAKLMQKNVSRIITSAHLGHNENVMRTSEGSASYATKVGQKDQMPLQTAKVQSYYKILACERESGNDFAYKFTLLLTEDAQRSLRAFRTVQQEFRTVIRDDYMEAFKLQNDNSLFVDFPTYQQKDGRIEGRAVVLAISVASLNYDPNTRTGRLSVRFNANQYEEARKWIRKNIETLARDKNIALTTGEIPPAAKFYLGREELKNGNVLEIEFKTE